MNAPIRRQTIPLAVSAFSMTELLVVISIMVMMLSLAVPAGVSLMESNNITRAGQMVADQIRVARQIAAAKNIPVEVRLIKTDSSSGAGYNAVQLWTTQFTTNAVSRLSKLPQSIAISENPTNSGLLASTTSDSMSIPSNSSAQYVAFKVMPSGLVSTTANMNNLFMTVLSSRYASATTATLPRNYVIIQINPSTGSALSFQP